MAKNSRESIRLSWYMKTRVAHSAEEGKAVGISVCSASEKPGVPPRKR